MTGPPYQSTSVNVNLGAAHIAFFVDDLHAAAESVKSHGAELLHGPIQGAGKPKQGERIWYFKTPWGAFIEILCEYSLTCYVGATLWSEPSLRGVRLLLLLGLGIRTALIVGALSIASLIRLNPTWRLPDCGRPIDLRRYLLSSAVHASLHRFSVDGWGSPGQQFRFPCFILLKPQCILHAVNTGFRAEDKAVQRFTEVLHHVVAFGIAVHQNV